MSNEHDGHGFSANKIFITLFILTAVEVAWSIVFKHSPHWLKWGGLCVFAFWKGILIYVYFMHMKFEGWVVKALIAPTPALIAILVCALMPDVSYNDRLVYPVGTQLDKSAHQPGKVTGMIDLPHGSSAPASH
jgi:caa(3)-type oxidase subunit IV